MTSPLQLGTITLSGLELPSRMPFGGAQRLAVHRLPGGGRVIDAMGADDRDVSWSATFIGPAAVSRARQLDAMRTAGAPVTLSWADFRRTAVISAFEPDYSAAGGLVPYSITLCLLPDAQAPAPLTNQQAATSLTADLDETVTDATLAASVALAELQLAAYDAFTVGTTAYTAALTASQAAASAAAAAQLAAESRASAAVAGAGTQVVAGADALSFVSNLLALGGAASSMASAGVVAARMGRVVGLL
ncbi:hypothetical protein FHR90_003259 [Endobacter medicaginis]|uniref:Uncharacterized protein n=1 Tax=Endobacter medicaginis TaxID=1181271 RepID=A0A850NPR6_9PROT|nr:hypothetical protein [Endobacter medicaginis]MBB3175404.1 hypothetical protein [Endobacter medicaginis]MCX5476746.1 hypothetical protein [Endobacter medicaginis]NVN29352.1 hypothetical protein [Endobacter medicaginis]